MSSSNPYPATCTHSFTNTDAAPRQKLTTNTHTPKAPSLSMRLDHIQTRNTRHTGHNATEKGGRQLSSSDPRRVKRPLVKRAKTAARASGNRGLRILLDDVLF
ncbi:hypothetical protein HPB50_024979 [Hyalomma asiaticum]|uniref:Uncharacterized protein n=1 Tax=Hyalomma asiaticum TaxID=266040 RepID=A0ACB7TQK9_HYAAI|nr:hypothetical protein HPB50_024979 [Hyalomma asiaticum]